MGQRLVVAVSQYGEDIAKIYYHWSAYSVSALYEAKKIIDVLYDDENKEKDLRLRLIKFCENNGGGIDGGENSDEWKQITNMYPNEVFKKEGINRNYGLIALSKKGMEDVQYWSEGNIYINLDENQVVNYVNCYYEDIDYYNEERSDWDDDFKALTLNDIPLLEHDLTDFSVFEIDEVISEIESLNGYVCRYHNDIYELIE